MRNRTFVSLLVLMFLFYAFYPQNSEGQTLGQRIEAGETYLNDVVFPQMGSLTEADQYIEKIEYHKERHWEYMDLHVEQHTGGIVPSNYPVLRITSRDYLWKSYLALLDYPSGTPIRFYRREIALSDINDSIPLADYLIPVVINGSTD